MAEPAAEFREREARLRLGLKIALASFVSNGNPVPEMIDLVGYDMMLKLLFCFGGRQVTFPKLSDMADTVNVAAAAVAVDLGELTLEQAALQYSVKRSDVRYAAEAIASSRVLGSRMTEKQRELLKASGLYDLTR